MFTNVLIGIKPDSDPRSLIELATSVTKPGANIHVATLVKVGLDEDEQARLAAAAAWSAGIAEDLTEAGYAASSSDAGPVAVAAGSELVHLAEQRRSDLIVIGLTKRNRVGKALLGSDAQTVLLTAPCPVLGVHGTDD